MQQEVGLLPVDEGEIEPLTLAPHVHATDQGGADLGTCHALTVLRQLLSLFVSWTPRARVGSGKTTSDNNIVIGYAIPLYYTNDVMTP